MLNALRVAIANLSCFLLFSRRRHHAATQSERQSSTPFRVILHFIAFTMPFVLRRNRLGSPAHSLRLRGCHDFCKPTLIPTWKQKITPAPCVFNRGRNRSVNYTFFAPTSVRTRGGSRHSGTAMKYCSRSSNSWLKAP